MAATPSRGQTKGQSRKFSGKPAAGGPGFKAVQSKIAQKQGISQKSAGAILGAAAKKSVNKSKAAGQKPKPNMKRVVRAQKAPARKRV